MLRPELKSGLLKSGLVIAVLGFAAHDADAFGRRGGCGWGGCGYGGYGYGGGYGGYGYSTWATGGYGGYGYGGYGYGGYPYGGMGGCVGNACGGVMPPAAPATSPYPAAPAVPAAPTASPYPAAPAVPAAPGASAIPGAPAASSSARPVDTASQMLFDRVVFTVNVPAGAKVIVNDRPTTSTGEFRKFESTGVQLGAAYGYRVPPLNSFATVRPSPKRKPSR